MRSAVLLLSAMLLACAAHGQGSLPSKVDDAGTTARVKTALIANRATKANQIDVATLDGVVQLSGFVDSEMARQAAVSTARSIGGVREVRDRLLIRDAERTAGQAIDDTVIAAKLKSELASRAGLGTASVIVEVNGGIVELSGFVPTHDQKNRAAEIARRISGVMDVKNNITVKTRG